MKKIILQQWILSAAISLALAGSTRWCSAVDTIVVSTFDVPTETNNWSELTGNGILDWVTGAESGGCLKVILPSASGGTQVQPQVALGGESFNNALYWSVSFDLKVDPASVLG